MNLITYCIILYIVYISLLSISYIGEFIHRNGCYVMKSPKVALYQIYYARTSIFLSFPLFLSAYLSLSHLLPFSHALFLMTRQL